MSFRSFFFASFVRGSLFVSHGSETAEEFFDDPREMADALYRFVLGIRCIGHFSIFGSSSFFGTKAELVSRPRGGAFLDAFLSPLNNGSLLSSPRRGVVVRCFVDFEREIDPVEFLAARANTFSGTGFIIDGPVPGTGRRIPWRRRYRSPKGLLSAAAARTPEVFDSHDPLDFPSKGGRFRDDHFVLFGSPWDDAPYRRVSRCWKDQRRVRKAWQR